MARTVDSSHPRQILHRGEARSGERREVGCQRTQERDPSLKTSGESGECGNKRSARVARRRPWGSALRLQEALLWVLSIRSMAITLEKEF